MPTERTIPKYVVEEANAALVRAIGRPRTVLDVGCGLGLNGAAARPGGAWVVGLDASEQSLELARARLDEVHRADIETRELESVVAGRKFDLILLADVLEHTRDPRQVLERMVPLLADGGRVIVSVPNVAAWPVRLGLLAGRFDYDASGIMDESHLRFFTRGSALHLLESAGLQLISTDLNPMLVRAAKGPVRRWLLARQPGTIDPLYLAATPAYRTYQRWIRPVEEAFAGLAPGWMAFQHVIVARRAPAARALSLMVGMLTRNEAESIAGMIDDIRATVPDAAIVIVDSSDDETPAIARRKGVEVLRQVPAQGHGPAMERLLVEAARRTDALIYLDCDRTYPVEQIPRIRALLEQGADVVNASRTRERPRAMPVANFLANRLFAATVRVVNGVPTTDVHSGMRGYRSQVLRDFAFDGGGDALPVDMLVRPARAGYRVVEIPIPYEDRVGASKLRKLSGTVWTFVRIAQAVGKGRRTSRDNYRIEAG